MGLDDLFREMLMGGHHNHKHGHHDDHHRHFRIRKLLTGGNIAFLSVALLLLLFFVITGLADVYNGVPVARWLDSAWKYIQGAPVSEIANYAAGEKLLTETTKNISPQDILSSGQQSLSLVISLMRALLDEILGFILLIFAITLKVLNLYAGRPSPLFSWIFIAASPVAALIEYI